MADVTISNLTYGIPSTGSFIPYTDNGVTLKVSPSGIYAQKNSLLMVGASGIAPDVFPENQTAAIAPLTNYNAIFRGGWLVNITDKNTTWGDSAARIGVLKVGAGDSWWFSHNADGSCGIHQSRQGDRIHILSGGEVTKPYQPFLYASRAGKGDYTYSNATVVANTATIPFNTIIKQVGDNYNTSTGLYTAPVNGVYLIEAGINFGGGKVNQMWPLIDGVRQPTFGGGQDYSSFNILFGTTILYLNKNQTVGIRVYSGQTSNITIYENESHTFLKIALLG